MELSAITAVAGCLLASATFFIGRQSAAKNTGAEWGELKTDIRYIKEDVQEIKGSIAGNVDDLRASIQREKAERQESIRRLHKRIDELQGLLP